MSEVFLDVSGLARRLFASPRTDRLGGLAPDLATRRLRIPIAAVAERTGGRP